MNKLISKPALAVLALLGSSVATAATITVTPSIANNVPLGAFSVTLSGDSLFPATTGATLTVLYNPLVVSVGTAVPIGPGFNFAVYTEGTPADGTGIVSVISTSALGQAGPFQAMTLNFTAIGAGNANIQFVDGGDFGWALPDESLLEGVQYNQANVIVAAAVPVPAAAWLFVSAIGGLATLKRRAAR